MADPFILDSNICEGYPSFGKNFTSMDTSTTKPYYIMRNYEVNESYPSFGKKFNPSSSKNSKAVMSCYPDVFESYPSFGVPINERTIEKPYPTSMISIDPKYKDSYPCYKRSERMYGAFADTPLLTEVFIPKSVKRIADYAFYNSAIKEVTISRDCIYGEHTFPKGCKIKFY